MEIEYEVIMDDSVSCREGRTYCSVRSCCSQASRNPELNFFRFPSAHYDENGCITFKGIQNLLRKTDWINSCGIDSSVNDKAVVCSKHFKDSDFVASENNKKRGLKLNAVPSLFLPNKKTKQSDFGSSAKISKDWEEEKIALLIALYKMKKCLYDKNDVDYTNSNKRNEAYREIQSVLSKLHPGCTIREIMYMISLLRSQYMVERREKEKSIQSGSCTNETYTPKMKNFDLLKFLDHYIKLNEEDVLKKKENPGIKVTQELFKVVESYPEISHQLSAKENPDIEVTQEPFEAVESHPEIPHQLPVPVTTSPILIRFPHQEFHSLKETTTGINESENNCDIASKNEEEYSDIVNESSGADAVQDYGSENKKTCIKSSVDGGYNFGRYVASKMKLLKSNASLQLQTEQAILGVLTDANIKLMEKK